MPVTVKFTLGDDTENEAESLAGLPPNDEARYFMIRVALAPLAIEGQVSNDIGYDSPQEFKEKQDFGYINTAVVKVHRLNVPFQIQCRHIRKKYNCKSGNCYIGFYDKSHQLRLSLMGQASVLPSVGWLNPPHLQAKLIENYPTRQKFTSMYFLGDGNALYSDGDNKRYWLERRPDWAP